MRKTVVYCLSGLLLLPFLAACGGGQAEVTGVPTPTPSPTLTFEERLTFEPGLPENPLRMMIHPTQAVQDRVIEIVQAAVARNRAARARNLESTLRADLGLDDDLNVLHDALSDAFGVSIGAEDVMNIVTISDLVDYVQRTLALRVEAHIFQQTSLHIELARVDTYGEARTALCDSGAGLVSMAWLDGLTYAAAAAEGCGQPALQMAVRGDIPAGDEAADATPEAALDVQTAELVNRTGGVLLINGSLGTDSLDVLRTRTFCRLGLDDLYSWLLPYIVMRRAGINPQTDLGVVVDYADTLQLARAVAAGECAAAGMSAAEFARIGTEDAPAVAANVRVVSVGVELPVAVFMYPIEVQLGVRLTLNDLLTALDPASSAGQALRWLLGYDAIIPTAAGEFTYLEAFVREAGFDFAQLGN